jgi:hypothetical protein
MADRYYYFSMGTTIYYGNNTDFTFFKNMSRRSARDVKEEVARLNKVNKLVAPGDEQSSDGNSYQKEITTMKLSEAIREGAKLHEQYFGAMFQHRNRQIVRSCAFGAAYVQLFGERAENMMLSDIERETGAPVHGACRNPVTGVEDEMSEVILYLNDEQRWTREAIADWLESLGY